MNASRERLGKRVYTGTPDRGCIIPIVHIIGLRPGEKLEEELLLDKEKDKVSKHQKIYISQSQEFDPVKLRKQIKRLERLTELMDEKAVIVEMKLIIGQ